MSTDRPGLQTSTSTSDPLDAALPPSRALATRAKRRRSEGRSLAMLHERLPSYTPSQKHRRIFEAVVFQHKHQLEVAALEGISQQRVSTIVRQVRDWIAAWGGEDGRYTSEQHYRIATHVAAQELDQLQRDVRFAIQLSGQEYHSTRMRRGPNGEVLWTERNIRQLPRPAALYRILERAIIATAKLNGAGQHLERRLPEEADGRESPAQQQSQAMVLRAEINVNQAGGGQSAPPNGALYLDSMSGQSYSNGDKSSADESLAQQGS